MLLLAVVVMGAIGRYEMYSEQMAPPQNNETTNPMNSTAPFHPTQNNTRHIILSN
jgi:hypothetical protein